MLTEQERRERHKIAKAKYDAKTVQYVFRLRMGADADIIERFRAVPAKTDYLRRLVREDIARGA
jgi:hypothetical protein